MKGYHLNPGSITGKPASFSLIKLNSQKKGTVYFYSLDINKDTKV